MAFSSWRTWTTSEVVTAAHMNQEVRDNGLALFPHEDEVERFTLLLEATNSNPTGNWDGFHYRVGALMHIWARFALTGNGSGVFFFELPEPAVELAASTGLGAGHAIGSWSARDDSTVNAAAGTVVLATATTARFLLGGGAVGQQGVDDDTPWSWAGGDILTMQAAYPVA